MIRRFAILPCLVAALLLGVVSDARADDAEPQTWYAQSLTYGDFGVQMAQYWSKGPRMRQQTVIGGHLLVTLVSGRNYYVINAVRGDGLAVERSAKALAQDAKRGRPFGLEGKAIIEQGGEKVREERIAASMCDVYRITDSRGRREVWIEQTAARLPLRFEFFDRASGSTIRTDYVGWMSGIPIDDGFFEPGSGVSVKRFTYDEYVDSAVEGKTPMLPIRYGELLHGR